MFVNKMDMAHVYLDGVVVYEHEDLFHSRIIDRSIGTSIFFLHQPRNKKTRKKNETHAFRVSVGVCGWMGYANELTISCIYCTTFAVQFCCVPNIEHFRWCYRCQIGWYTCLLVNIHVADQRCWRWRCCIRCWWLRRIVYFHFDAQIFGTGL